MSTLTDVDWDLVIDLEFEPPCGITQLNKYECGKAAEWWAEFSGHCKGSLPFELLLCAAHYTHVVNGGLGFCLGCRQLIVMRDHVLQLERIKP